MVSDSFIVAWNVAGVEAARARHATIKPGHFLIGLCKLPDIPMAELLAGRLSPSDERLAAIDQDVDVLRDALSCSGVDRVQARRAMRRLLGAEDARPDDGVMHRSQQARDLCDSALRLAGSVGDAAVRPVHLLWALCRDQSAPWLVDVRASGIDPSAVAEAAESAAHRAAGAGSPESTGGTATATGQRYGTPTIDRMGRDLTRLAADGALTPLVGRRAEVRQLAQALLRRTRNNAILVGDAGVGKTCIVEGFAQYCVSDSALPPFRDKRIVELSMASLVSGTRYRGEFEERLQAVVREASADRGLILFIDEIHTALGAGAVGGEPLDAANILKPALARGDLRCIGATTTAEYRRYVARDPAFERRFEVVWVEEPTRAETLAILSAVRPGFEKHHGLAIAGAALEAAVDLSMRYGIDRRLPAKALDLLDETCARVRMRSLTAADDAERLERADVAAAASDRYRVPPEVVCEDEAARLLRVEAELGRRIVGQDAALAAVGEVLRASRAGLVGEARPRGVFLFLGPTGTGKTALAQAVAEFVMGDEDHIIRLDMSEYSERHSVSKLIGSPPGYVGYDEEGQLTGAIRTRPAAVVLLDEIEKADPEVHRLLLQVLGEGRLTDAHGRRASFAEAIVIMTSNLGSSAAGTGPRMGFLASAPGPDASEARTMEAVKRAMPPELLNRIDRVVHFQPLRADAIRRIADIAMEPTRRTLAARDCTLSVTEAGYEALVSAGFSEAYGAREMQRAVARLVAEPLARALLEGRIVAGGLVTIDAEDAGVQLVFGAGTTGPGTAATRA